jgi:GTP cyclohydrolase II
MTLSAERAGPPGEAVVRTSVSMPIALGPVRATGRVWTFDGLADRAEHLAVSFGAVDLDGAPLVRVHSECLTGDVLGSLRCDCGPQLHESVRRLSAVGGLLLYLRQEGRGVGLYNKLDAYALQERGADTYAANRALGLADDLRDYTVAAQMLRALGVDRVRLLTGNPDKVDQLAAAGVDVVEVLDGAVFVTEHNARYLEAKRAWAATFRAARCDPLPAVPNE